MHLGTPQVVVRITPIRLAPKDADRYVAFRKQMLADSPWAFSANPDDDVALDATYLRNALAQPDSAVVAIESDEDSPSLVAAAGIYRVKNQKFSHRAKLWGVFVAPGHRGRGFGRAVTSAALELAMAWSEVAYVDVAVSENSPAALRICQSLGFIAWGREPESTQHDGQRYDEIFLSLRVERSAGA